MFSIQAYVVGHFTGLVRSVVHLRVTGEVLPLALYVSGVIRLLGLNCVSGGDCRAGALLMMPQVEEMRLDHNTVPTFVEELPRSVCRVSFHEPESVWIARHLTGEALDLGD
jgi:hypothetical protein